MRGTPLSTFLEKCPQHWWRAPMWSFLSPVKELGYPALTLLSVYRDHGVVEKDSRIDNHNRTGENLGVYQRVLPGDVVMNKMKAWQGSIAVSLLTGIVSPDYQVLRPKAKNVQVQRNFLHFLLRSTPYVSEYRRLAYGIRPDQWRLMYQEFRGIFVAMPPVEEQIAISRFLDRKIASVDALILTKERIVELLWEKRQALITQAVTRGLAPGAPMKDSGIEWLGKIPTHWGVVELRRRWKIIDCKHRTPTYVDDGYPLVSTSEVKPGRLDLDLVTRRVSKSDFVDLTEGRLPKRGDIIYSRNASLGAAAYVGTDEPFCMGQDVVLITSTEQDQLFLMYVLNSPIVMLQVELACVGATFKRINVSQIQALRVPLPPLEEQRRIGAYIDEQTNRISALIHRVQEQIDKLREYRQALITAAVTGKIDPRTMETS